MIDTFIETHLRSVISAALPAVDANEILVKFPSGTIEVATTGRISTSGKPSIGEEALNVAVVVTTPEKIDRHKMFRELPRKYFLFDGVRSLQECTGFEQKDLAEPAGAKIVTLKLTYTHDVFEG